MWDVIPTTWRTLESALKSIENGDFGDLSWIEEMPLSETNLAFQSLHNGTMASAKVILKAFFLNDFNN